MKRCVVALTGATAGVLACSASAQTVVIPNDNAVSDGPSNQGFPFNSFSEMRYQQLFAADEFAGLSGLIDAIAYRTDEGTGFAFGPANVDCQIWLGYTDQEPTQIGLVYDDNFSSGKTLVFDGIAVLSSAGGGDFDIVIDVDDFFDYNGVDNLLMEVKVFGVPITTQFDAAGTGLGIGGTDATDRIWAFGANTTVGSDAGDDGMVTQFTVIGGGDCYADCNDDGAVNIFDFLCFQGLVTNGDDSADCNGDSAINIFDFLCFQGAVTKGC